MRAPLHTRAVQPRRALRLLLVLTPLATACAAPVTDVEGRAEPVVYDNDDRLEVYEHPSALLRDVAVRSVAALVFSEDVDESDPEDTKLFGDTLDIAFGVCDDQRFADQPTSAFCSATLIAPDLVITAGHCVENDSVCDDLRVVFDYYYEDEGRLAAISQDDVYRCAERVSYSDRWDTAVVRLDRAVSEDRVPVTVHPGRLQLPENTPVSIIGYGSGLPAKIDDGGVVLDNEGGRFDRFFLASTDSFAGNSGSGVFDAAGRLVGTLSSGAPDYVRSEQGCFVPNVIVDPNPDDDDGETVMYAWSSMHELCLDRDNRELALCEDWKNWCRECLDSGCAVGGPLGAGGTSGGAALVWLGAAGWLVRRRRGRRG